MRALIIGNNSDDVITLLLRDYRLPAHKYRVEARDSILFKDTSDRFGRRNTERE
jgi:hypothetical protein